MELIEQKKGIFIGIGLTLLCLYGFGLLPRPFLMERVKEDIKAQDIGINQLLDETKSAKLKPTHKTVKNPKKKPEKGQEWGVLKKMVKDSPVAISAEVAVEHGKAVTDEKAEEKEDKEKEEDKNAKAQEKENVLTAQYQPPQPTLDEIQPEVEKPMTAFGGGIPPFSLTDQPKNQALETVEEWIAYLSNTPTWDKTENFIRSYKSQVILESVFYSVIEALIAHVDPQVRNFGFLALGGTPSLRSFQQLVEISSQSDEMGNHTRADKDLRSSYIVAKHLSILSQALDSNEDHTKLKATEVIEASAKKNLKTSSPTLASSNTGRAERLPIYGNSPSPINDPSLRTSYQDIASKLEHIANTDQNAELQNRAGRVAQTIHQLLQGFPL